MIDRIQQKTEYTCGAAALRAVMRRWGKDASEEFLSALIGISAEGCVPSQIVTAARRLGFSAQSGALSLCDAADLLSKKIPLIIMVVSFNKPDKYHYVVLSEVRDGRAEIMDPNTPGNWRSMPIKHLLDRWWSLSEYPPHDIRHRVAVVVTPR